MIIKEGESILKKYLLPLITLICLFFIAPTVSNAQLEDGIYSINYQVNQPGQANASIANDYFGKPAKLFVTNGAMKVQLTVKNSAWINEFNGTNGGNRIVSSNPGADTRVVEFNVSNINNPTVVKMRVDIDEMDYHHSYSTDFVWHANSVKLIEAAKKAEPVKEVKTEAPKQEAPKSEAPKAETKVVAATEKEEEAKAAAKKAEEQKKAEEEKQAQLAKEEEAKKAAEAEKEQAKKAAADEAEAKTEAEAEVKEEAKNEQELATEQQVETETNVESKQDDTKAVAASTSSDEKLSTWIYIAIVLLVVAIGVAVFSFRNKKA